MAFSFNDAFKNIAQNVQDFSNKAASNIVNNQFSNNNSWSPYKYDNSNYIGESISNVVDIPERDPMLDRVNVLQSNLPRGESRDYMTSDEYFDSMFNSMSDTYGGKGSGNIENVPFLSDYNGFNLNDFPAEMYPVIENSDYQGVQGASTSFAGDNPANYTQQAADLGDQEREDWMAYLANHNLKKEDGSSYTGTGDFQLNGSEAQWKEAILSDELSKYYEDIFKEYGGSKEAFDFDSYWNAYKPVTVEDIMGNNEYAEKYFGGSVGNIDDFAAYVGSLGGYDHDMDSMLAGKDAEEVMDIISKMNSYKIGDMILQNMLSRGANSDELFQKFTVDELNQLFRADPNMFTTDPIDAEGSLNSWGKNNNPYHDTGFNIPAYNMYGQVPYAGLADTITALAGDDLYYKPRPKQNNNSEGQSQ